MAPGAKKMMTWEFQHAYEAMECGIYVTWVCPANKSDDQCTRVGADSKCFCGHLFKTHEKGFLKNGRVKNNCNSCACKAFAFIPRRPEEIGEHWLPRRKGFNINTWGASCQCKHTHKEHDPVSKKCKTCGCFRYTSAF